MARSTGIGTSRGRWPLVPLAPVLVSLVALAAAALIALVATRDLQAASDASAELDARTYAATEAARLGSATADERTALLAHAASRVPAGFVLFEVAGAVVLDRGLARVGAARLRELTARGSGLVEIEGRRMAFAVQAMNAPLDHLALAAFTPAPSPAEGSVRLGRAVAVLTLLMLGVAVGVALVLTSATREDLRIVRQRIAELAEAEVAAGAAGHDVAVPIRSFDQVGALTVALNGLVARFDEAAAGYRSDLEAAAQIDAERSQFLAGLSHELRTPLNAVLGFSHLLETESDGPLSDDAREALAMIRGSGGHLKALIDDILDLSAAETGQLRLAPGKVEVRAVAEEVVREARATAANRPVRVVVEGDGAVPAWADPRRVRQILTNLVSNALKATAEGEVRVSVARAAAGSGAVLVVSDTGRGIEPEVLGAIFEPYRQAGDAALRRGGAGLGLAIARELVRLHGGTLEAASARGIGSTFTVTLPAEPPAVPDRASLASWAEEPRAEAPSRDVLPSLTSEITERRRRLRKP